MFRFKALLLVGVGVVLLAGLIAFTRSTSADDRHPPVIVETREVPEGIVTESMEEVDSPFPNLEGKPVEVYTNVIVVPEGTITERIEVIDPLSTTSQDDQIDTPFSADDLFRIVGIEFDDDTGLVDLVIDELQSETPALDKDGNPSPLSWSIFADDLYATCSPGVKFDYSSTTGTSYYTLRWNGGQTSNSKTCSGAQCNYIISTNWSDYYTYADVQIPSPALVWGPSNAYRCK